MKCWWSVLLGPDEVLSPAASYGSESGEELPMTTEGTFNEALSVTDVILDASRESNEALPPRSYLHYCRSLLRTGHNAHAIINFDRS
jgi:hypothetical protein